MGRLKAKRLIILLIQIVAVLGLVVGIYTYVQKQLDPVEMYVFNKDLEVNTEITEMDITAVPVTSSSIIPGSELDKDNIIGKYVGHDVIKNQTVFTSTLKEEGELNPLDAVDVSEYRKISLPIDYEQGFGGNIKAGDSVDLIYVGEETKTSDEYTSSSDNFTYGKTFLQDVMVYNVTTADGLRYEDRTDYVNTDTTEDGQPIDSGSRSNNLSVITLLVTLDEAEEISARQATGEIKFVSRFAENEVEETRGFILGEYDRIYAAPGNAEKTSLGK